MKPYKDLIIFLLINIFFVDLYIPLIMSFHITDNILFQKLSSLYCIFNIINRFYLLPLCLLLINKYTKSTDTKKHIFCLRNNTKQKILALLLSFILSPIIGTTFHSLLNQEFNFNSIVGSLQLSFIFNPFIGLYQAYLIMYIYWGIWNLIKSKFLNKEALFK